MGRSSIPAFLASLLLVFVCTPPALALAAQGGGRNARRVANDGPARVFMFNMTPGGDYSVKKNAAEIAAPTASPWGAMRFSGTFAVADQIEVMLTGVSPVDPTVPANVAATGTDAGCAVLSWSTPSAGEYVHEYRVVWGATPGAYTDSSLVPVGSTTAQGGTTTFNLCGLATGSYVFALRAHNLFDRWSAYSVEAPASVTNGSTQGPPPPSSVTASETSPGCVSVNWNAVGDPSVAGYVVFSGPQSVSGGQAAAYNDSSDVGNSTAGNVCGLPAGRHYFAVKSYTGGGLRSAYSSEVWVDAQGADTAPPQISGRSPGVGATGIPRNQPISFHLSDDKAGVDTASVVVTVDGAGVPGLSFAGDAGGYVVTVRPVSAWPASSPVDVRVDAADLASPANVTTSTWRFTTSDSMAVDDRAPTFVSVSPSNGAVGVARDVAFQITVADTGFGVDAGSIVVRVGGRDVSFTATGSGAAVTVRYVPPRGWTPGAVVRIEVDACDAATPANCSAFTNYSFVAASDLAALASESIGQIVPDGFWANDPARALEIRNIPLKWTVRIFDTAGRQVRSFTNRASEGSTWLWDFSNNSSLRVARGLYLVRVVDSGGSVRHSGRFVVQMGP